MKQFTNPEVAAKFEMVTQQPQGVTNQHYSGPLENITMPCAEQMQSEGSRHLKLKKESKAKPPKVESGSSSPADEAGN